MTSGRSCTWNTEANALKSVHIQQRTTWGASVKWYFRTIYILLCICKYMIVCTQEMARIKQVSHNYKNANYVGVGGSTWSQHEPQKQIKLPTFCMAVLDSFSAPERTDRDWPVAFAGTNAGQAPTAVASHRRWCMNWSWWHPDKSSRFKPTCFCLNRLETRTSQNYQQAIRRYGTKSECWGATVP